MAPFDPRGANEVGFLWLKQCTAICPDGEPGDPLAGPQACGIADQLRVIYVLDPRAIVVSRLKPGTRYQVTRFDPVSGQRTPAGAVIADAKGQCCLEPPNDGHDWVLFLRSDARQGGH